MPENENAGRLCEYNIGSHRLGTCGGCHDVHNDCSGCYNLHAHGGDEVDLATIQPSLFKPPKTVKKRGGPRNGRLLRFGINIDGHKLVAMLDTGASMDFISRRAANELGLPIIASAGLGVNVKLADGSTLSSNDQATVQIQVGPHAERRTLQVLDMDRLTVVLGIPWMDDWDVMVRPRTREVTFAGNDGGRHIIDITDA